MKTLLNISLISASLLIGSNAFAAKAPSENALLTECKALANTQFDNVKKVKLAKLKNTRGKFQAKFKVIAEADRGTFLCTIDNNSGAQIVRLDKSKNPVAAK